VLAKFIHNLVPVNEYFNISRDCPWTLLRTFASPPFSPRPLLEPFRAYATFRRAYGCIVPFLLFFIFSRFIRRVLADYSIASTT